MSYNIDLSGRVALVTGASSGLGTQFAKTLARAGANGDAQSFERGETPKTDVAPPPVAAAIGSALNLRERLADVAVRTYQAAGLRDYGRIDVRLAHDNEIYIVEANPNPYLADGEDLAWAAEEGGEPYPQLIDNIAASALSRGRKP